MTAHPGWRRRPSAVRLLALMSLMAAASAALGALLPMSPQAPVVLDRWLAGAALLTAAAVWWVPGRAVLHLGVLAHLAGLSAVVATAATGTGAAAGSVSYVWVALYAGFFLGRTAARAYVGLLALTFAGALALNPFPGALHVWVLIAGTTLAATETVGAVVERLRTAAATDPLTGVLNRSGLRAAAVGVLASAARTGRPLTIAVADLDGFKLVNDAHGHAVGDRLLVDLVASFRASTREGDVVARLGGDEFCLLLPDTGPFEAAALLERLRRLSPQPWSAGLAVAEPGDDLDALLARADRDLYRAKALRPGPDALPAQRRPVPAHD